jgi:hypothetical protein
MLFKLGHIPDLLWFRGAGGAKRRARCGWWSGAKSESVERVARIDGENLQECAKGNSFGPARCIESFANGERRERGPCNQGWGRVLSLFLAIPPIEGSFRSRDGTGLRGEVPCRHVRIAKANTFIARSVEAYLNCPC